MTKQLRVVEQKELLDIKKAVQNQVKKENLNMAKRILEFIKVNGSNKNVSIENVNLGKQHFIFTINEIGFNDKYTFNGINVLEPVMHISDGKVYHNKNFANIEIDKVKFRNTVKITKRLSALKHLETGDVISFDAYLQEKAHTYKQRTKNNVPVHETIVERYLKHLSNFKIIFKASKNT